MSTNTALDQIKNRVEGAKGGTWGVSVSDDRHWIDVIRDGDTEDRVARCADDDIATFIAESRTDVPKLLAALEAVEALAREAHWDLKQANEAHGIECHQMHAACLASLVLEAIEEALR